MASPPALRISSAAVYIVPSNLGWGFTVLAKIAIFAPDDKQLSYHLWRIAAQWLVQCLLMLL